MHYIRKYGLEDHLNKIGLEKTAEDYLVSLLGKINYVLSVCSDKEFEEYRKEIRELI